MPPALWVGRHFFLGYVNNMQLHIPLPLKVIAGDFDKLLNKC